MSILKGSLFVIWFSAVALVVYLLLNVDMYFSAKQTIIAKLRNNSGYVNIRSEGDLKWKTISNKYGIADGDNLTTSEKSNAEIDFSYGRRIKLEENSEVKLTAIRHNDGYYSYILTLIAGGISASYVKCKKIMCYPILIKSGRNSFELSKMKKLYLFKKRGGAEVSLKSRTDLKNRIKKYISKIKIKKDRMRTIGYRSDAEIAELKRKEELKELAELEQQNLELKRLKALELEKQRLAALALQKAQMAKLNKMKSAYNLHDLDYNPEVVSYSLDGKKLSKEMWSLNNIDNNKNIKLIIKFKKPIKAKDAKKWQPILLVYGADKKLVNLKNQYKITQNTIAVSLNTILRQMKLRVNKTYVTKSFSFTLIAQYELNSKIKKTVENKVTHLVFNSYVDKRIKGHFTLVLNRWLQKTPTQWFTKRPDIKSAEAPLSINLSSSSYIGKFASNLYAAKRFSIKKQSLFSSSNIYYVKDNKFIGEVTIKTKNKKRLKSIVLDIFKKLNADIVFKGNKRAMYDVKKIKGVKSGISNSIKMLLNSYKTIYALNGTQKIAINREFLQNNPEVGGFIDNNFKYLFVEKVEVFN